jgi:hypothetical protein
MVPVTVGTQEILTFRTPGGRQFRFVVMITYVATLCCCCCHVNVSVKKTHRHCQELRPILEVTKNAKSSTAIVHIERDLEEIDAHLKKISQISQIILLKLINKKEMF